jgi:hypothetical protein
MTQPRDTRTNPWHALVKGEYGWLLDCDKDHVRAHNTLVGANSPYLIETQLLPEPWHGPRDAPVVLLLLNPGVSASTDAEHSEASFELRALDSLTNESADHLHLASLNPAPGREWWDRAVSQLTSAIGRGARGTLAKRIGSIQLFPYHSKKFAHAHIHLPSQYATLARAEAAMDSGAILLVRGLKHWVGVLPRLHGHQNVIELELVRQVLISQRSVGGPANWSRIVGALTS